MALMVPVQLLQGGPADAIPFSPSAAPIGTRIFAEVGGNPVPASVRFHAPVESAPFGFSGTAWSDSVSAGGRTAAASASLGLGELVGLAASPTDPVRNLFAYPLLEAPL